MAVIIDLEAVPTTADDGHETPVGTWVEPFSLLQAGIHAAVFHGGIRFTTIPVPQGATIDSATLNVDVYTYRTATDTALKGKDVDDADAWTTTLPSDMAQTTATGAPATGTGLESLDIQAVVQELVDRGGWSSNNAMGFAMLNQATGSYKTNRYDQYHSTYVNTPPTMNITYTAGGGGLPEMDRMARKFLHSPLLRM